MVPVVVLLACVYLLLAPVIQNPGGSGSFTLLIIVLGLVAYFPFVHMNLKAPGMGRAFDPSLFFSLFSSFVFFFFSLVICLLVTRITVPRLCYHSVVLSSCALLGNPFLCWLAGSTFRSFQSLLFPAHLSMHVDVYCRF